MSKDLLEGLRFGQREKSEILSSLDSFKFGFEIELHPSEAVDGNDYGDDITFYEYVLEEIERNDYVINSSSMSDFIGAVVDIKGAEEMVELDLFRRMDFLNPSNLDELLAVLPVNSGTSDMFYLELVHGIASTISDIMGSQYNAHFPEIHQYIDDISSRVDKTEILLGHVGSQGISMVDTDETLGLTTPYKNIIQAYKNLVGFFTNRLEIGTLGSFEELDDKTKELVMEYSDEFYRYSDALSTAISDLREYPGYTDEVVFGPDAVLDDHEIIETIKESIEETFGSHETLSTLVSYFSLGDDMGDLVNTMIVEYDLFDDLRDDYDEMIEGNKRNIDTLMAEVGDKLALGVDSIKYEVEADGQYEIISMNPVSGTDIIVHYNDMKKIIDYFIENGMYSDNRSGLHLSISFNDGHSNINKNKFIVLSQIFEMVENDQAMVREYVKDMFKYVKDDITDIIDVIVDSNPDVLVKEIVDYVNYHLRVGNFSTEKFHGINFAQYYTHEGRVELRIFGGIDYEEKIDEYFEKLIRFLHVLKVSSDDTHDKEYYQGMYKIINLVFSRATGVSLADARYRLNRTESLLSKFDMNIYELLDLVKKQEEKFGDVGRKFLDVYRKHRDEKALLLDKTTIDVLTFMLNYKRKS